MLLPELLHILGAEVTLAVYGRGRQQIPSELSQVADQPFRHRDIKTLFAAAQNLGRYPPCQGTAEQILGSQALQLQGVGQRADMCYQAGIEQRDAYLE